MDHQKAVVIIVSETGHVENHLVHIDKEVTPADLERTVNLLNERLTGIPLAQLQQKIQIELSSLFREHITNYEHVLSILVLRCCLVQVRNFSLQVVQI